MFVTPEEYVRELRRYLEALLGISSSGSRGAAPSVSLALPGVKAKGRAVVALPGVQVKPGALGPRGWLGALFAHGSASLMYEINYLKHHRHLLPSVAATWNNVKNEVHLDYSRGTLMARRFQEWQCPLFDSQSPDFRKYNEGVQGHEWRSGLSQAISGDGKESYWITETYLANDVRFPVAEGEAWAAIAEGTNIAAAVQAWILWTLSRDHQGQGRALDRGLGLLLPHMLNQTKAPAAWNGSTSSRRIWGRRLLRWYWVAQFAIWSCEMVRIHRRTGERAPNWWAEYCAAWGIGCRDVDAGFGAYKGESYVTAVAPNETGEKLRKGLKVSMSDAEWEATARRLIALAFVPGHSKVIGSQIAAPGKPRHVFDVPEQLGSAVPPLYLGGGHWNAYAALWWMNHTDISNFWTSTFLPVWNSVFSSLSAAAGSSAFSAFITSAQAIYQAGARVMQAGAAIANGELPDSADVVGAIAKIAGEVGALAGADVGIPDDLWEQLKSAAPVAGYAGELAAWAQGQAEYVRSTFAVAQKQDGYAFLDDLIGGIVQD